MIRAGHGENLGAAVMAMKYAYSFDREDYIGAYDTTDQALNDAVRRAEELSNPPTEIYIGTIVEADPQATDHAEQIIDSMNRRAHVEYGASAARYLKNIPPQQVKELDDALAATILAWLKKHNLMPSFVRVREIHQRPVNYPGTGETPVVDQNEVQEIGPEAAY
jgi:hypothetical protein